MADSGNAKTKVLPTDKICQTQTLPSKNEANGSNKIRRSVVVHDCRFENQEVKQIVLDTSGLDFNDFLQVVSKTFHIPSNETFVLTCTDRKGIDFDQYEELQEGSSLYLLRNEDQVLPQATLERIIFLPHYDTLIRSGMYEYYASEGQKSLPYAFAELIDNALSATSSNTGMRTIDIRLLFDESMGKPAVVIMDNGCGMTSKQLNSWAVYRLSKFTKGKSTFSNDYTQYVRPDPVPRSLNSDISFFGVGGKQAVFYIGQSTRMITKPACSPDVHELVISKEEFERKEQNKEDIYTGFIRNRKTGDSTHVTEEDERFLHGIIQEEAGKPSFTVVVVTGVQLEHITFLKQDFHLWTRELAHLYHYYIHGLNGNDMRASYRNSDCVSNIDIQISLLEKFPKMPRMVNLREIDNDMQTLYINASADSFEFKAYVDTEGTVEGILRYHPFLYDKETYPEDPFATPAVEEEEDDCAVHNHTRAKRPIFECFWNGRLIPYTTVSEFDWCALPKKAGAVPAECYSRISGVLFTNDRFQVSTNKLTFMDLELQLKSKDTLFTRILNGQEQRVKIHKEFLQWLKTCHEKWDKQVKFKGFKGTITRMDVATKKMQFPWATFSSIEWDGKTYKAGQYVKSQKTVPIFFGSIVKFLLYGDHDSDVYATGGQVQIAMEPKALHDEVKTIPISKIDRVVSNAAIKKGIDDELAKLPEKLKVSWPEGNPWTENDVRPAGTPLGPLHVEILNRKGESISRIPSANQNGRKALSVELKIIWHSPNGDVETNFYIAAHASKWAFWFRTMENLIKLGKYTLYLNTILNESNTTVWAGNQLPNFKLDFTITEGSAASFVVGTVNMPLHVGVPFNIPLQLQDEYGHPAPPPPNLKPILECTSLKVSYEGADANGTILLMRGVSAKGTVHNYQSKTHNLNVVLPGLQPDSQTLKISLLPGNPDSLKVTQEDPIIVENGSSASFDVEVHDIAGNLTAHPKLIVRCQFQVIPGLSSVVAVDCSNTGAGTLVLKPITIKNIIGEQMVKATFDIPNQANVTPVLRDLRVVPSTRVSRLEVCCEEGEVSDVMVLKDREKISWIVGDLLENLYYKLYDEAGREVPLSKEMAQMIKVNWTADVNVEELARGKLPNVSVPTLVNEEHFYQISYKDQLVSVDTSFIIVPRPDEPKNLKAKLTETTVRMGEVLQGDIYLELTDQYGNQTPMLNPSCMDSCPLTVDADGLDKESFSYTCQENNLSMLVTGLRFKPCLPGVKELLFKWRDFEEHVTIKVTAGVPAKLVLVDGPQQPLQVLNEQGIETPFVLQLVDAWGNPSPDQRVVVTLRPSSPVLKVKSSLTSQPVDKDGKASFRVDHVKGPKGEYAVAFRGTFTKNPIHGPSVKLMILPDPNKPVKLVVEYDTHSVFPAGGTLPVFSVSVVSEEGSTIKNLNPANISMLMWKGESSGPRPPQGAAQLKCSKPMADEKMDSFYFRDKVIPDHVGKYTIQFVMCMDKTKGLWSHQYVINVVANDPVKLAPDSPPPTPVVTNNNAIASRTLVQDMSLKIMDVYNNPAGLKLSGRVVVTIKTSIGSSEKDQPLFEGKSKSVQFHLANGESHITNLSIMENSPGQDAKEYVLHFRPSISGFSRDKSLEAFELPFHFYNDVQNTKLMSELTRKKDQLNQTINIYKSLFETNRQLITELSNQVQDATNKESRLKSELRRNSINISQLSSIPAVEALISQKTAEMDSIKLQTRRVCSMPDPFKGTPDVLGKIGHLALVEDDDVAKVISWHLLGDMDCVVTTTTEAARKVYDHTQGKQQVMPLDTVFWRNNSNRPLPHIRNGQASFHPIGNPVFARELLIFPENAESCQMVFGNLLGDTILTNDLDSANHYRKGVVQSKMPCPTLLTRQGDRIRSNGKFGGLQNKAPPIEKLRGQVFGAPLPKQYDTLMGQIDLLKQYQQTLQNSIQVKEDLDTHMQYLNSPEMVKKEEEMEGQRKQLKEIETKLASTPVRTPTAGMKRNLEDVGGSSGLVTKRIRQKIFKK
ncbi:structural maintenance of chromosomes flexible hinge domain-containing protein 1 [Esox lucius]|uniref:SMC hinge domain-containing protein n=1 Tax=Esox lucius TaxID=8010 RepID=A0AAY5KH72_ESOLU|nr:structural maintenance of chromosomes flexible hinge domain-containing protein 1 [Esox lucius]